jgi:hypothetical protein
MSDAKLTIRVPQTWLDTLKHAAIDRRTTATAIVLEAVTQYLNTKEDVPMMIREMSPEQLDALVIDSPWSEVGPSRYDWSQFWPVVDADGIVREIVDGTEEAPSHLVFDESNDCYRYQSDLPSGRIMRSPGAEEDAIMQYTETTYTRQGADYPAIQIAWADLEAAGFVGDGSDDKEIETALLAAGAPEWVKTAPGWIVERGYGLYNTIVYSDALCEAFNLADLEAEFGTVDVEGNTYYLTQQAYITGSDDDVCYEAAAIASNGDVYTVRWAVCEDWQEIEDESDRCDWAKPISVTPA